MAHKLLFISAILGLTSVVMGALADHAFSLTPEQTESMATAIRYNMLYAVLTAALSLHAPHAKLHIAATIFCAGTMLFCFSIYASLATGIVQLTYLTPLGGLTLMAGWATLAFFAITHKKPA